MIKVIKNNDSVAVTATSIRLHWNTNVRTLGDQNPIDFHGEKIFSEIIFQ